MDIFKSMPDPTAPEPEVEQRMFDCSAYVADGETVIDRRADKEAFISTDVPGSSAIYAREGGTVYLHSPVIHGYAPMTEADMKNELASKYGFSAAVLANCKTTNITLVEPKIVCHEDSTANGAYAIFHGAVVIKGGSIDTNNRLGHGVDASYGGHIYCDGTTIHTGGNNSGALATDFQGGYITVRNIHAETERPGSPGIYTAGKSIITAYDSTFISHGCEAVMVAHSLGHTYLYGCDVTGVIGLNAHNGMSPEYSYLHMFGGRLTATGGALLNAEDGKGWYDLEGTEVGGMFENTLTNVKGGGKLVCNLNGMAVGGEAKREPKSYLELNLASTAFVGSANATVLTVDGKSKWEITGDSAVCTLSIAPEAVIFAKAPVTVKYGALAEGAVLPEAANVTFVKADLADDYEAKKMGPPPGGMPGEGGPGMPGMPMPPM